MSNTIKSEVIRNYANSLQISYELASRILYHPYRLGDVNKKYPHYPIEIEKIIYEDKYGNTCSRLINVKY